MMAPTPPQLKEPLQSLRQWVVATVEHHRYRNGEFALAAAGHATAHAALASVRERAAEVSNR
jgi:hypothetical protein